MADAEDVEPVAVIVETDTPVADAQAELGGMQAVQSLHVAGAGGGETVDRRSQERMVPVPSVPVYSYDAATNGRGRLAGIVSGATATSYSAYDQLGRAVSMTQTTGGTGYALQGIL